MQILPAPPTDNIYKFAAITGIWFAVALAVIFLGLAYVKDQNIIERQRSSNYDYAVAQVALIARRLDFIASGNEDSGRLVWMPISVPVEAEKPQLDNLLREYRATVTTYEATPRSEVVQRSEQLVIVVSYWFYVVFALIIVLAVVLTIFGFGGWYRYVQRPAERLLEVELKLRHAELKKLELELRNPRSLRHTRTGR